MKFVTDKDWLLKHLAEKNVRIVDCRFSLADSGKGSLEYGKNHLPNAAFFDLEKDLSGHVYENGGRHPLPNIPEFISKLEQAGINENTTVIAYDQGEGAFAARFWWLLRYLGHEKVYVLDGGFKSWVDAKYPLKTEIPVFEKTEFKVNIKEDLLANVEDVRAVIKMQIDAILVDSREERRYLGLEEPIDKKAGRIPGAINRPWFEGLNSGCYKSIEEQKKRFSDIDPEKQVIVYCGSGVTAVPNFLALKEAGYGKVKLYLGSFSDWISYQENEIE